MVNHRERSVRRVTDPSDRRFRVELQWWFRLDTGTSGALFQGRLEHSRYTADTLRQPTAADSWVSWSLPQKKEIRSQSNDQNRSHCLV